MRRHFSRGKLVAAVLVLLLAAGAAVLWTQRLPLLSWYCVRSLARAGDGERDVWVERVVSLDGAADGALVDCLCRDDVRACGNAGEALAVTGRRWGAEDRRWPDLAARVAEAFPRFSPAGQAAALRLLGGWLGREADGPEPPDGVAVAAGRALARAANGTPEVHARALAVAEALVEHGCPAEQLGDCRGLVQACLRDADPANRASAVRLAVHPDLGLLEEVAPLLRDPAPAVRREAMLAARLAPETVVKTDDLLHWLHDSDEDVRRLCEAVLGLRGMTNDQIKLGRMLTDPEFSVRLGVLGALAGGSDLEPGVWLRLLSADPEPAVRVAAVRFASDHPLVDLSDRIDQMAHSDPSPTVRQLARMYLGTPRPRKGPANVP